jgi:Uma2 family endonuclease
MSPSRRHERIKVLLGRLFEVLTEELGMEILAVGSTTLMRVDLERGLEPDASYYLSNEAEIRGRTDLDLHEDPPPDLAIEVDVTRKSLDRLTIYAALGVPEVWRYKEGAIEIYQLREGKGYITTESSSLLPEFPVGELAMFLDLENRMGDNQRVATFRAWVRNQLDRD